MTEPKPKPAKEPESLELTLLKDAKTKVEYKPFQSEDAISLSIHLVRTLIAVPAKDREGNELLPDDRQCLKFVALNRARKLNPYEGDSFMIPFFNKQTQRHEWSLITAHGAFLKRAEMHPDYNGKQSGVIVMGDGEIKELEGDFMPPDHTLLGGWCKVHYKNKAHPEYQRLKLETYSKPYGNWTFDAAGMICKCAEAAALRSAFPNTMGGMYLREEMGNGELTETIQQPPALSRPIFSQIADRAERPNAPELPQDEKTAIKSPPPQVNEQEGGKAEQAAGPIAIRLLLKTSKIKESELLAFLTEIGLAEAGTETLEELSLQSDTTLARIAAQWQDMAARIVEARVPAK